ncbi:unnamed protein product [Rhizophagus irregularis]|uniref:Uncharacterized protein n=1 Tax=Rhizophagus irregularis TaxID=588596 RepID=A0A2N1MLD1_9GLOM|nr:hypothetical protein RhiirC2_790360 [Rhizophagus irregularis]CAB4392920.1 unnamed protein product [Rhizophagus irregularis]
MKTERDFKNLALDACELETDTKWHNKRDSKSTEATQFLEKFSWDRSNSEKSGEQERMKSKTNDEIDKDKRTITCLQNRIRNLEAEVTVQDRIRLEKEETMKILLGKLKSKQKNQGTSSQDKNIQVNLNQNLLAYI